MSVSPHQIGELYHLLHSPLWGTLAKSTNVYHFELIYWIVNVESIYLSAMTFVVDFLNFGMVCALTVRQALSLLIAKGAKHLILVRRNVGSSLL